MKKKKPLDVRLHFKIDEDDPKKELVCRKFKELMDALQGEEGASNDKKTE